MVVIGCCLCHGGGWGAYTVSVFVYVVCMRATTVYIYQCICIRAVECETHLNMIIVPAGVCVCVLCGGLRHSQEGEF